MLISIITIRLYLVTGGFLAGRVEGYTRPPWRCPNRSRVMSRLGRLYRFSCRSTQRCRAFYQLGLGLVLMVILGAILGLGLLPPAWAANALLVETQPNPSLVEEAAPAPSSQPDASTVPSETVSRFVNAYLAVVKLIESREPSLQGAETETESRQMQQEIQAEAINLIQANDLTLQAYWELLGLTNSDPEFRERVLAQIEEASL